MRFFPALMAPSWLRRISAKESCKGGLLLIESVSHQKRAGCTERLLRLGALFSLRSAAACALGGTCATQRAMWASLKTTDTVDISFPAATGENGFYTSPDNSVSALHSLYDENSVHGGNAFAAYFGPKATKESREMLERQFKPPHSFAPASADCFQSPSSGTDLSTDEEIRRGLGLLALGLGGDESRKAASNSR